MTRIFDDPARFSDNAFPGFLDLHRDYVVGDVLTSPSTQEAVSVGRAVAADAGVVFVTDDTASTMRRTLPPAATTRLRRNLT